MSNVRQTVTTALGRNLPYGAESHVDRVVTALEARDTEIADRLRTAANEMGARRDDVEALLVEVGLVQPAPVQEQAPTNGATPATGNADPDLAGQVAHLSRQVEDLLSFARRHGYVPATTGR